MKTSLYRLLFVVFTFTFQARVVIADDCSEALNEFENTSSQITNKRLIGHDDLKAYQAAFEQLQILTEELPCYKSTLEATKPQRLKLKEKRIETLNLYFNSKIFEEAGNDLLFEFAVLTGKKSGKLSSDELFSFSNSKQKFKKGIDNYEAIAISARESKMSKQNNSCSDRINQNEAVNLDNARDQDTVGWCYAYTAADLLSYRLKQKISAVSLYDSGESIEKNISDFESQGGEITKSITSYLAKNKGLCLEEDLPSSDFKFCTFDTYRNFLLSLYQSIEGRDLENSQCLQQNLNSAFPGINYSTIKNYADKNGSKNLSEYLFDLKCKKKSFPGYKINPVDLSTPYYKADNLVKNIDTLLDKNEIVGFAYKPNVMNENDKPDSGHATVIVGRRLNTESGECEYLIRNSYGKDCDQAEGPGLSCHKNCDNNGVNCRYSGHFWASQRRLKNSILHITYLP